MSRTPSRSRPAPARRTPPKRTPKRGASSNGSSGGAIPALKTWLIVGGGVLGIFVLWQVLGLVLGHGDEVETRAPVLITTGPPGRSARATRRLRPPGPRPATSPISWPAPAWT